MKDQRLYQRFYYDATKEYIPIHRSQYNIYIYYNNNVFYLALIHLLWPYLIFDYHHY